MGPRFGILARGRAAGNFSTTAILSGLLCTGAALALSCETALAYTPTVTPSGNLVRLRGDVKLNLAGNPRNQSGLSPEDFRAAVMRGLQRWKEASGGAIGFDYWQGTDSKVYEPNSDYNGLSSVYFASNAPAGKGALPSNVLGLTQVWYNTDSGDILESDIELNDLAYRFTTDPKDTSGYGSSDADMGDGHSVFIENVLTHEIGHAFGMSHSGGLQSTMLFMESPEQAYLGCDEQVGIRALYQGPNAGGRGAITGTVTSERTASPLFGAHVVAISRRRGTVLATAVTDRGGRYTLGGLEPGSYFLMVEPFFAGSSALPGYYAQMSNNVCSGLAFSRSVLTSNSSNTPRPVRVDTGSIVEAPQLIARCGSSSGASISSLPQASSSTTAPVVQEGSEVGGFGVVDRYDSTTKKYYKLHSVGGRVEVHAMAYSLYSPIHPSVELLDAYGNQVSVNRAEKVYVSSTSGYVNYDSALIGESLPIGDYVVQVSGSKLDPGSYPAGMVALDSASFLMLTGSVNESESLPSPALANNARCKMSENFATYTSPAGNPPRASTSPDQPKGGGFCGSVKVMNGGKGGDGRGGSSSSDPMDGGAIAGWFLPWALMAIMARWARWARRWRSAPAWGTPVT